MASPPSTRLGFLGRDGEPLGAPPEWEPAFVEVRVEQGAWEAARLSRHGQPLELQVRRLGGVARVVAEWPRSNPGRYRLRLEGDGAVEELEVELQPRKITPDAFARMLEDLEARLPAEVALALQRAGALAGVELLPPGQSTLAQELERLRRAVRGVPGRPGLAASLAEIARDPHRTLVAYELWVRAERVRRPAAVGLVRAATAGGNLGADGRPERVPDTRAESTYDVHENRMVRVFADQVAARLRRLSRALPAGDDAPLVREVRRLAVELGAARRVAGFLEGVRVPAAAPTRLTMVLMKRPAYRAAYEGYLEFLRRAAVRLEVPGLDAPLENLPYLYQVWGTLHVAAALLEAGVSLGYVLKMHRLTDLDAGGLFVRVLPDGKPVLELVDPTSGATVELRPERSYRPGPGALRSAS